MRYEIKSKKTGRTQQISEDEYRDIIDSGIANRFIITELSMRPIVPTIKPIKTIKTKKNEG